ncbi:MAG: hypothetical protein V4631_03140 [Pseudomonadota bacterium]
MIKLLIRLLLCVALSAAVYWLSGVFLKDLGLMRVPFTIVATAFPWVKTLAPYVIDLFPAIRRKAISDVLEPWNGRYYAYDNRQVRLYLIEGVIWVPVRDVASLLLPQPEPRELRILAGDYGPIPGQKLQGYTEAGLLRLLSTRCGNRGGAPALVRFKNWLEKEAFPNLRRHPGSSAP